MTAEMCCLTVASVAYLMKFERSTVKLFIHISQKNVQQTLILVY